MRAGWWAIRLQISFKWNLQSASKQKINHRKHYKIDSIPQEAGWKTLAWQEDLMSNSDMEILNSAKKIQAAKIISHQLIYVQFQSNFSNIRSSYLFLKLNEQFTAKVLAYL
jgi:hypothetical protein